jgi:hypothetical protein
MIYITPHPLSTQKNLRFFWEPALSLSPLKGEREEIERGAYIPLKHPVIRILTKGGSFLKRGGVPL